MSELTRRWRAKYPGDYDDMDDATLEKAILAKYPEYKDLAATPESDQKEQPIQNAKKLLDSINNRPSDIDSIPVAQPPKEGMLSKIYRKSKEGLVSKESMQRIGDLGAAGPMSFIPKFLPDAASDMTSPLNLGMLAASGGESMASPIISKLGGLAGKLLSIPTAIEGAHQIGTGETVQDKLSGAAQVGMSVLPFLPKSKPKIGITNEVKLPVTSPKTTPKTTGELTAPHPTAGTPSFSGRQKITLKAGENLDKIKEVTSNGYELSHQAPDGSYVFIKSPTAPITEGQVVGTHPTTFNTRTQLGPQTDTAKTNPIIEALNLPRAIMASTDMSAPLRQGLPLIHKKEFWKAIPDMVRSFGSEETFQAVQESIGNKPLFKPQLKPNGKLGPSFAQEAGLKLTDLHDLSSREEALMSSWAEKIPAFGKLYRASERSYTAFLNKLRADTFENLIKDAQILNPETKNNLVIARDLAKFVNTATGRGSLGSLESSAQALNSVFFSPRLIASRVQMLNPLYYTRLSGPARKEALKSLLAVTTFGNAIGQIAKLAGADVETNPGSSDFGKVRIGNTRLDPWGGFQQYIVATNRILRPESWAVGESTDSGFVPADLVSGFLSSPGSHMKSTVTGNDYKLGSLSVGSNKFDVAERFAESKLNPVLTLATAMLRGKDITGKTIDVPEEVASRFVPILVQDFKELATENPNLLPSYLGGKEDSYDEFHPKNLPFLLPAWFGMGVQHYTGREQ